MAKRIFLCAADAYKHFAWSIQKDLAMQGHDIFCYFTDDTSLELVSYVLRQVSSADCLLIFTSPNAIIQTYELNNPFRRVLKEAFARSLSIIPLMFMDDSFDSIHYEKHLNETLFQFKNLKPIYLNHDNWDATLADLRKEVTEAKEVSLSYVLFKVSRLPAVMETSLEQGRKAELAYERGIHYYLAQEYGFAHFAFDESISLYPDSYSAYNNRALAKRQLGDLLGALKDINEAISLRDDRPELFSNRSLFYLNLKQINSAIEDANRAIWLNPEFASAYNNRSMAFYEKGNKIAARRDLNKSLSLNPSTTAYLNRAMFLKDTVEQHKIIEELNKAVATEPDNPLAYFWRAELYTARRQYAKAISDFDQAINLYKKAEDLARAYNLRGLIFYKLKRYQDALNDFDFAIDFNPNVAQYYDNRARTYLALAKPLAAFKDFIAGMRTNSTESRKKKKAR